jgi:hypothetical protein
VRRKKGNKLLVTEVDYVRKSCRRKRLERIQNGTIRKMMETKKDITDKVQKRQLIRFGHTNRTGKERQSRKVLKWVPQEERETRTAKAGLERRYEGNDGCRGPR